MGRKRNIFVRKFFIYDAAVDLCICRVCGAKFMGQNVTNLKRHMINKHKERYENEKIESTKSPEIEKKTKLSVAFSNKSVNDACLELAIKQIQPPSFFDTNAFKFFTEQIFKGLKMSLVNSNTINAIINERYVDLKQHIMNLVKGRMVSIKMDFATRLGRSVLGINLYLVEKRKLMVYTLSMTEMFDELTEENLKLEFDRVLLEFDISKEQIYTIVIDKGINIFKTVDLLFTSNESNEDEEHLKNIYLRRLWDDEIIVSLKPAAHFLQLAVEEFCLEINTETIDHAQEVVRILQSPFFRQTLLVLNMEIPQVVAQAGWDSTFVMLESLLHLKSFCSKHLIQSLNSDEWTYIEEYVDILSPVYEIMMKLQRELLFLGDIHKLWLTLKHQLESKRSKMAIRLMFCLNKEEKQFLNLDVINAALYLDPRFRRTLTTHQKENAKKHLKKVECQLLALKSPATDTAISKTPTLLCRPRSISSSSSFLLEKPRTQFLDNHSSLLKDSTQLVEMDSSSNDEPEYGIKPVSIQAFEESEYYKNHKREQDLMEYWEGKKFSLPNLRQLARIVHSVPATQFTMERAFTALRLILDEPSYTKENFRSFLLVKLNEETFQNF